MTTAKVGFLSAQVWWHKYDWKSYTTNSLRMSSLYLLVIWMLVVLVLGIWKCCGNWLFCPKERVDGSWNSVSPTELFPFSDIPGSCCHHSSAIRSKFTFYYLWDRIQDLPPLPEEHFGPLIFVYLIFLCVCVIIFACNWHGLDRFNSTLKSSPFPFNLRSHDTMASHWIIGEITLLPLRRMQIPKSKWTYLDREMQFLVSK